MDDIVAECRAPGRNTACGKSRCSARSSPATAGATSLRTPAACRPSCNCSSGSTRSTASRASVSPRRIRVGFKQDLVEAYGRLPKLCEYVHLPLQSGSDRILRAMNRPYTRRALPGDRRRAARGAPRHAFLDRCHRRFSRRDRGGLRADPRALRGRELRHGLHLQVFHPHRHARGRHARPGARGDEGGAQPDPAAPAREELPPPEPGAGGNRAGGAGRGPGQEGAALYGPHPRQPHGAF